MCNKNDITYKGIVEDSYYPDDSHNSECGGFKTPEDAFKWVKENAHKTGFTNVHYWVEYECSLEVDGFSGST